MRHQRAGAGAGGWGRPSCIARGSSCAPATLRATTVAVSHRRSARPRCCCSAGPPQPHLSLRPADAEKRVGGSWSMPGSACAGGRGRRWRTVSEARRGWRGASAWRQRRPRRRRGLETPARGAGRRRGAPLLQSKAHRSKMMGCERAGAARRRRPEARLLEHLSCVPEGCRCDEHSGTIGNHAAQRCLRTSRCWARPAGHHLPRRHQICASGHGRSEKTQSASAQRSRSVGQHLGRK